MSCRHRRHFDSGNKDGAGRQITFCPDCGATFTEPPDDGPQKALGRMLREGLFRFAPRERDRAEGATLWAGYMIAAAILNVHRAKGVGLMRGGDYGEPDAYLEPGEAVAVMDRWAAAVNGPNVVHAC